MGIPGHMYGAKFSIGPYPLKITDLSGNTSFQISSIPYNLRLHYEDYTNNIFVFDGVTNNENFVTLPLHYYYTYSNNIATINVHFPTIPPGNRVILKFISNELFRDWNSRYLDTSYQNSYKYSISLPFNKNSISGKLIFFLVTVDTFHNSSIISFDKYGEKQITLSANSSQYVEFSEDDIKTDPDDVYTDSML